MLLSTFLALQHELKKFLENKFMPEQPLLTIEHIAHLQSSNTEFASKGAIVITLLRIDQNQFLNQFTPTAEDLSTRPLIIQPTILITPVFTDYKTSLRYLEAICLFIHEYPRHTIPHPYTIEFVSTTFEQNQQIWSTLGLPQKPAVVCKINLSAKSDIVKSILPNT